jgi:tetratricopeptide (TPR) repeat protein
MSDIRHDRALLLWQGFELGTRFEDRHAVSDINSAIDIFQRAAALSPNDDIVGGIILGQLGYALTSRFRSTKIVDDVNHAIPILQKAVELNSSDDFGSAMHFKFLGEAFYARFEHNKDPGDLDKAIAAHRQSIKLPSADNDLISSYSKGLGMLLSRRFLLDGVGKLDDIKGAIAMLSVAVEHNPSDIGALRGLGDALIHQFESFGQSEDLSRAIAAFHQADKLLHTPTSLTPSLLYKLSKAHLMRYERSHSVHDVNAALAIAQRNVELPSFCHSPQSRVSTMIVLGNAQWKTGVHFNRLNELDSAICTFKDALTLDLQNGERAAILSNLSDTHRVRFHISDRLEDLDEAFKYANSAVEIAPSHASLNNLSIAYISRFHTYGNRDDLDQAVTCFSKALKCTPYYCQDIILGNACHAFTARFDNMGTFEDMDRAISVLKQIVDHSPDPHPRHIYFLCELAQSYGNRFDRFGEPVDIENAFISSKKAVSLAADSQGDLVYPLSTLAGVYYNRFNRCDNPDPEDIQQAITHFQRAHELSRDDQQRACLALSNIANCYRLRLQRFNSLEDAKLAIEIINHAIDLAREREKAGMFTTMGISYHYQFGILTRDLSDLESAISAFRNAVDLTPDGHPYKSNYLKNLANALQDRYNMLHRRPDFEESSRLYDLATTEVAGMPSSRLTGALFWARLCFNDNPSSAMPAFERVFEIIPQIAWLGQRVGRRYEDLKQTGISDAVSSAVATAITAGHFTRAVEWLDQGRNVIWGQLFQLRSPMDDLLVCNPELAQEFQAVSNALEKAGAGQGLQYLQPSMSVDDEANERRATALKYESLLKKIREMDGFEDFLRPKRFAVLARAATSGPVVMVNAARSRCDALVLLPSSDIIHVPLPHFSYDRASKMRSDLIQYLRDIGVRGFDNEERHYNSASRKAKAKGKTVGLKTIIQDLCYHVVEPILQKIQGKVRLSNFFTYVCYLLTEAIS